MTDATVHVEDQPTPVKDTATCLACGSSRNMPHEKRLRDLLREMRRQLEPAQRQADEVRAARATVEALRTAARHPYKGPDDTDASMLLAAADRLEVGYEPGGSNTKQTVARVLRAVAAALPQEPQQQGHEAHCPHPVHACVCGGM